MNNKSCIGRTFETNFGMWTSTTRGGDVEAEGWKRDGEKRDGREMEEGLKRDARGWIAKERGEAAGWKGVERSRQPGR